MIEEIIFAIGFIILAPFIGALIGGIDRKVTARMQGRVGPPVLQPLYDIFKLFEKEKAVVRNEVNFYIFSYLIFVVFTGALFFSGGDILLVIFALTLAHAFLILGAYAAVSPYSHVGAERELLQLMAVEPMLILAATGFYMATGSFAVKDIALWPEPVVLTIPLIFVGIVYVLTIKLRKSPFDLATTHHAHQELVKGLTTEFAGPTLGMVEIAHLYETVFFLGIVWLFFASMPWVGLAAVIVVYFLEILVDNTTTRVRWQVMLRSAWLVALVAGAINLGVLALL
ncbi:respiratory chain complex I subunit 1 family protein [Methanogenium organophilum]|uniref:NADH-quinone oxidoreductase subunit H n=1 Tax=Methanogenium organophilum TaxID=2199 RepID=A0A9X9S6E3_METOG|nr:complex I subunit 1 family protein [Methanogenium organophilum]WAI02265.1 NADH-quinone oxidoreductase subunit H [Methanogenium organophilum]